MALTETHLHTPKSKRWMLYKWMRHLNAIFIAFYYQTKRNFKKINNPLSNTHTMLLKNGIKDILIL
jgi:hypothetical protein